MISQEVVEGDEFTIDVFCDSNHSPVYIVPRKRLKVKEGKSIDGVVIKHPEMESWVRKICNNIAFLGPINIQCFLRKDGVIQFIEINPKISWRYGLRFCGN